MKKIIITAPSLDPTQNVSGVSSVAQFIIERNTQCDYVHFLQGKKDKEKGGWRRVVRILHSYREWKRLINQTRDALVHYSFPLSAPSILRDPLFMFYVMRKKRKMVVHVHGGLFLTAPKIPFVLNKILKWVFSWDVPFIVLSEGEKKKLQERFGAKIVEVLPNCPDLRLSPTLPVRERVVTTGDNLSLTTECTEYTEDVPKPLVMGYLGRIEPNKGMTELLEACKILQENGVNFRLRFAGKEQVEGEYLPLFRNNLGESFEYVGLVSGKTKDAFLRSLDVFVMPTYFEGLPVSLLECMGYGVVPVVTPVGSIPDVVRNLSLTLSKGKGNANGVFVKVRDVDSIVEAVTMLYNDRETLKILSRNARNTILENFSAEKYVERLNSIYESL